MSKSLGDVIYFAGIRQTMPASRWRLTRRQRIARILGPARTWARMMGGVARWPTPLLLEPTSIDRAPAIGLAPPKLRLEPPPALWTPPAEEDAGDEPRRFRPGPGWPTCGVGLPADPGHRVAPRPPPIAALLSA